MTPSPTPGRYYFRLKLRANNRKERALLALARLHWRAALTTAICIIFLPVRCWLGMRQMLKFNGRSITFNFPPPARVGGASGQPRGHIVDGGPV